MSSAVTVVLDTSASPLLVAVEKDGKIFSTRRTGIKQEKLLFPALHKVLGAAGATLNDVKEIFIIRGPGRFTGIRIALTFASMMQYLAHACVKGATVFEVISRQVQNSKKFKTWKKANPNGVLAVVLHAFREEYFLQFFDEKNAGPRWLSREELLQELARCSVPLFVAGTDKDFTPLTSLLAGYTLADSKDCRVRPQTLLAMNREEQFASGALEPLYLKPARFELIKPV